MRGYFFALGTMTRPVYNKDALLLADQTKLLRQRNLTGISDSDLLLELETKGYYRISGYAFPYQDKTNASAFLTKNAWNLIATD